MPLSRGRSSRRRFGPNSCTNPRSTCGRHRIGRAQGSRHASDPGERGNAMKTVSLQDEPLDLDALINMASKEPILLLTVDGKEFVLAEADDFEQEVETLRRSQAFQRFLDE